MKTHSPASCANAALTLIEVLVVVAVLAVFAVLLLPAGLHSDRTPARRILCVSNLKQVGLAYRLWSGDHGDKGYPMSVPMTNGGIMELAAAGDAALIYRVMSNELKDPKILACPEDVERHAAIDFSSLRSENVSYFVGMDAVEIMPQRLLSGDRNITNENPGHPRILDLISNEPASWTQKFHHGQGNLGLADGSVMQLSSRALQKQISQTGLVTNRLAVP